MSSQAPEASAEKAFTDLKSSEEDAVKTGVSHKENRPLETQSPPQVKKFYLVDFENTGLGALDGIENLDPELERFCLFSTEKAPKIPTATLLKILNIQKRNADAIEIHEVPVKDQSIDMHLVSYLGYLIATHGSTCKYVIQSNDTDYDNIVKFWKTRAKVDIARQGHSTAPKKSAETTPPKQLEPTESKTTSPKTPVVKEAPPQKTPITSAVLPSKKKFNNSKLNNLIMRAMGKAGYSGGTPGKVASIVCKCRNSDNFLETVLNQLKQTFPNSPKILQTVEAAIKGVQTPSSKSPSQPETSTPYRAPRTQAKTNSLKNAVIQILSKAKVTPEATAEIAKIAAETYGKENAKQALHGALTKKYSDGLEMYNLLKKLF